jgi:hypothetical protein
MDKWLHKTSVEIKSLEKKIIEEIVESHPNLEKHRYVETSASVRIVDLIDDSPLVRGRLKKSM